MKQTLLLYILLTAGCISKKTIDPIEAQLAEVDSVIAHNQEVIQEAQSLTEKADSVVKEDISKMTSQIEAMNQEVAQLRTVQKIERVRIDTVYIETKKNFWGREKTKTTVVSDSIVLINTTDN